MNNNKTLDIIITVSVILIIGLSSFLGYQLIKFNRTRSTSGDQKSGVANTTITPAPDTPIFFATVDRVEGSQIHLTLIEPPKRTSPQDTITKAKISNPVIYYGPINDILIPAQHFQKQPSVSDILQVYGEPSNEGLSMTITKINVIK